MSDRSYKYIVLIVSVLGHGIAYFQFKMMNNMLIHSKFNYQLKLLFIFSILGSIIIPIFKKKVYIRVCFLYRAIILVLISLPFSGYIGVTLTMFVVLIFEMFAYIPVVGANIFSIILLLILLKTQHNNMSAFWLALPNSSLHDLISFGFYSILIIILSGLLTYRRDKQVSISELNKRLNNSTLELAQTNIKLQNHLIEAKQNAAKGERKQIAQEIHDSLAYFLTNIIMMLEAGIDIVGENEELLNQLGNIQAQAKEGLNELRRILKMIRSSLNTKVTGMKSIKHLVDSFREATKIDIVLNSGNVPLHFEDRIEKAIYRLVQEGITNSIRHGRADKISIVFFEINNCLKIYIEDNGIGCEGMDIGYGLMGMRERIESLGGKLEFESKVGEGYLLLAWIPLLGENIDEKNKGTFSG